jgi:hypothetical protein
MPLSDWLEFQVLVREAKGLLKGRLEHGRSRHDFLQVGRKAQPANKK